jgi:hypothetical protein
MSNTRNLVIPMQKLEKIDYAQLLGFTSVSHWISGGVDFQDETIGAKLGAKVGAEPVPKPKIDYAKLLGFDAVSDKLSANVDFQDETLGARLGAKVGAEVLVALDLAANRTETRK